jgi:hypothetical protein
MIRQWAILTALSLLLAFLAWDFMHKVVLYDPFAEMGQILQAEAVSKDDEKSYRWAWGRDIAGKNLFSQERGRKPKVEKPPEQITRPAPPRPEPLPRLTLSGIIKNPDGSLTAYIKVGENPVTGVRMGDKVYGVTVEEIEERSVKLRWREREIMLKLKSSPLFKKR